MASALLRTSARGGSTFGRFLSAARSGGEAPAARPLSLRRFPLRHLSNSSSAGDQLPKGPGPDEKICKVDQMQRQVQELNQLIDKDIAELLNWYKEYQAADHGYFERFLTKCDVPKSKFRDDFIWYCQYSTMFVLSGMVGYLLAGVEEQKN